jgi:hypothetical protein
VTNLLVMEKSGKDDWLRTFSWMSLMSEAGLVVAMVAGYFWLRDHLCSCNRIPRSFACASAQILPRNRGNGGSSLMILTLFHHDHRQR